MTYICSVHMFIALSIRVWGEFSQVNNGCSNLVAEASPACSKNKHTSYTSCKAGKTAVLKQSRQLTHAHYLPMKVAEVHDIVVNQSKGSCKRKRSTAGLH